MNLYWVSWWSASEELPSLPQVAEFNNPIWITGYKDGWGEEEWCSFCAAIEADTEEDAYDLAAHYDKDYREDRFAEPLPTLDGLRHGGRFLAS